MRYFRAIGMASVFAFCATVPQSGAQPQDHGERQDQPKQQQQRPQEGRKEGQQQQRPQNQGAEHQEHRQRQQQAQQPPQQRAISPQPQGHSEHQQQTEQRRLQRPESQPRPQTPQQTQRVQIPQEQRAQEQRGRQAAKPVGTESQARGWQQRKGWLSKGGWQGRDNWQQSRAQNWSSEHRNWAQRGGYGGYRVPQNQFSGYLGSQHSFRLRTQPVFYMGYPRFSYGGYWFMMLDPWPEYWGENWYTTDDVYVSYTDGYYLCNRRYPQIRLAISIEL